MLSLYEITEAGVVNIPDSFRTPSVETLINEVKAHYQRDGFTRPWICFLVFEDRQCVGICGFKAPPKDGKVQLIYSTLPAKTDAAPFLVRKLIEITEYRDRNAVMILRTPKNENPETHFLKGLGITQELVEVNGIHVYEWQKAWRVKRRA